MSETDDKVFRERVASLNMLKDYSYTPQNVVLVTVDDLVELFHDIYPYTMKRLDDVGQTEEVIRRAVEWNRSTPAKQRNNEAKEPES